MAKRILVLSSVHSIGHPRFGNKIVKTLADADYDVEVWARDKGALDLPNTTTLKLLPPSGKITRLLDLPTMLGRIILGKHDLIVIVPPETVPLGLFARFFGKKVLWDVEEDAYGSICHSDWIHPSFRKFVADIYVFFERLSGKYFDGITLAEESYKPRFKHSKNVAVLHNYPPRPAENIGDMSRGEIANKRWSLPGPRLIYIGTMTEERGLMEVIKTVNILEKRLPDIHLDVLGDIPSPLYRNKINEELNKLNNNKRVVLHGRVPFEKLYDHMSKAHFGLLPLHDTPNFRNSEPTKVFEYSLAGLPMIVGNRPAWRKIVDGTGVGAIAKPCDTNEWANAIEDLWNLGPDTLQKGGELVHDYIYDNNLFWDEKAKRLISLCENIMK